MYVLVPSTCVHVYAGGYKLRAEMKASVINIKAYRKYLHNRSMSMEIRIMRMSEYSYVLRHKTFNVLLTLGEERACSPFTFTHICK